MGLRGFLGPVLAPTGLGTSMTKAHMTALGETVIEVLMVGTIMIVAGAGGLHPNVFMHAASVGGRIGIWDVQRPRVTAARPVQLHGNNRYQP